MADRIEMMFHMLMDVQSDLGLIKREQMSQGIRLAAIDFGLEQLKTALDVRKRAG